MKMNVNMHVPAVRFACVLALATSGLGLGLAQAQAQAQAQSVGKHNGMLTDANGRVLYTFDKDADHKSNCTGGCLAAWPAFTAKSGDKPGAGYSMITRDDDTLQWALNGKPLYYFAGDGGQAGVANGDGKGGVWHVVKSDPGPEAARENAAAPRASASPYHSAY